MPRRFDYKAPPAAVSSPVADVGATAFGFVVQGRRPGGVVRPVTLEFAEYPTPVLARQLGGAWVDRFRGELRDAACP
jgi:hypothetical protein